MKRLKWLRDGSPKSLIILAIFCIVLFGAIKVNLFPEGYHRVYVKNSCAQSIRVATYYRVMDCRTSTGGPGCFGYGSTQEALDAIDTWDLKGWTRLDPEQQKFSAHTRNQYVLFYAEIISENGSPEEVWSGDQTLTVGDATIDFYTVDLGKDYAEWVEVFECNGVERAGHSS